MSDKSREPKCLHETCFSSSILYLLNFLFTFHKKFLVLYKTFIFPYTIFRQKCQPRSSNTHTACNVRSASASGYSAMHHLVSVCAREPSSPYARGYHLRMQAARACSRRCIATRKKRERGKNVSRALCRRWVNELGKQRWQRVVYLYYTKFRFFSYSYILDNRVELDRLVYLLDNGNDLC